MKLRIDFSVRETDVPPEDARGVRFGDDIDAKQVFDFFNKCRDAVLTIFNQRTPKDPFEEERKKLEAKIAKLEAELAMTRIAKPDPGPALPRHPYTPDHDPGYPYEYRPSKRWTMACDGSRGGDGPSIEEIVRRQLGYGSR